MSTSHAEKHSTNSVTIISPDNATTADSTFTSFNTLMEWFVNSAAATSAEKGKESSSKSPWTCCSCGDVTYGVTGTVVGRPAQWWAI